MSSPSLKIYIAGPDVFMPDPIARGEELKTLVSDHGHIPLFPLDNEIKESENLSKDIFDGNVKMLQQADIILANLNTFRGHEPDSGTVWEVGYAKGLGKRIIGYAQDLRPMKSRINPNDHSTLDDIGWHIEDFDHAHNLMIVHACETIIEGDIKNALQYLEKSLQP